MAPWFGPLLLVAAWFPATLPGQQVDRQATGTLGITHNVEDPLPADAGRGSERELHRMVESHWSDLN